MSEAKKPGINSIELSGNVVKDATVKSFESGAVAFNFRLAVNRKFSGRDGSEKKETLFINAVTFPTKEKEAEVEALLRKGSGVYIKGPLTCRIAEREDGKREFFEVRAFEIGPTAKTEKPGREAA